MDGEGSAENPMIDSAASTGSKGGILRFIPWLLIAACGIGIVLVRNSAGEFDHALANLLTGLLGFLIWLIALIAIVTNRSLRSYGVFWAFTPVVVGIVFFAFYKFDRFSSEMVPQFSSRWDASEDLPTELSAPNEQEGSSIFQPTAKDFPQFLGPNRTAVLNVEVRSDWDAVPPEVMWKQSIGEGWSGFATQGDAAITMEQRDDEEWVTAYNIEDGSLIWKHVIAAKHTTVPGGTGPRSTPTIHDNRVYASSAVGEFVCLELQTGNLIWSQNLMQLGETNQSDFEQSVAWGRSGSALVVNGIVYIPLGGPPESAQPIVALNAENGEEIWRAGSGQISYSSPIFATLGGHPQVVLVSEDKVASYEPTGGDLLWEIPWEGKANANPAVSHPVVVGENQLLLAKGYGHGSLLIEVQSDGENWQVSEVWRSKRSMKTKFATAVVKDDHAYGLSDGILECISLKDGERVWKKGRYKHGQLLLLGDHLLILSEDGELVLVSATPDQFEELQAMPVIEGISWNTIALSGDRLLIRNSDEAACVRIPLQQPSVDQQPN